MHEREITEVLMVEWDKKAVLEVSCDVVSEVLKYGWDFRSTDWYRVISDIKGAFDNSCDTTISDSKSLLAVRLRTPRQIFNKEDLQSKVPAVEAVMAPIDDHALKYVYWQRLGQMSGLMRKISSYYCLTMPTELSLTFPPEYYAKDYGEFKAVILDS